MAQKTNFMKCKEIWEELMKIKEREEELMEEFTKLLGLE